LWNIPRLSQSTKLSAGIPSANKMSCRSNSMPDRQHCSITGDEPAVMGAPADPSDGLCCARKGRHHVADRQILHRHLAAIGRDQRAAAIAGGVADMDVGAAPAVADRIPSR